jgi:hypothetical protein
MNIRDLEKSANFEKIKSPKRFKKAIEKIDSINQKDPNLWKLGKIQYPREWIFGIYHFNQVIDLDPNASELLLIAARGQHIARWMSLRTDYPEGRVGYLKWRADLKVFHANKCAEILREIGYTDPEIEIVKKLNLKKNIKSNLECQILEDSLCLVFLEQQFDDLAKKYPEEKMVPILQKTAKKMSQNGIEKISSLSFTPRCQDLLKKAFG